MMLMMMMKLACASSCMSLLTVCLETQMECFDGRRVRSSRPGVAEGPWLAGMLLLQFAHAICCLLDEVHMTPALFASSLLTCEFSFYGAVCLLACLLPAIGIYTNTTDNATHSSVKGAQAQPNHIAHCT